VAIVEKKAPLGISWEYLGEFLENHVENSLEKVCVMPLW